MSKPRHQSTPLSGLARPSRRNAPAALLVVALAQVATAQVIVTPDDDPALHQGLQPGQSLPTPPVKPQPMMVNPNAPVLPGADLDQALPDGASLGGPLLAEGSFLAGAKARPFRGKSGSLYLIFDADQKGPSGTPLPAMVLMPNLNLASIERLASRMQPDQRILVSGQVFFYAGVNFLPATTPPIVEQVGAVEAPKPTPENSKPAEESRPATGDNPTGGTDKPPATAAPVSAATSDSVPPATAATPEAGATPAGEPAIEEIIERLDKAVGAARRVDLPKLSAAEEQALLGGDESPAAAASVPGGYLTSRRGRVVRSGDGSPMFVFDTGASSRGEPPLFLLPCMNLSRLENVAASQGEKATVTLSGDVVMYHGKSYLLPRMIVVNRRTDVVVSGQ